MKIRSVGAELIRAERTTDGHEANRRFSRLKRTHLIKHTSSLNVEQDVNHAADHEKSRIIKSHLPIIRPPR